VKFLKVLCEWFVFIQKINPEQSLICSRNFSLTIQTVTAILKFVPRGPDYQTQAAGLDNSAGAEGDHWEN